MQKKKLYFSHQPSQVKYIRSLIAVFVDFQKLKNTAQEILSLKKLRIQLLPRSWTGKGSQNLLARSEKGGKRSWQAPQIKRNSDQQRHSAHMVGNTFCTK